MTIYLGCSSETRFWLVSVAKKFKKIAKDIPLFQKVLVFQHGALELIG